MSELSDAFEEWPRNPYELLGVKSGVSLRDLKLAYTKLIRRFKPERFPAHFQRIRQAFEQLRRHAVFVHPAEGTASDDEATEAENHEQAYAPGGEGRLVELDDDEGSTNGYLRVASPASGGRFEESWAQACAGDLPAAYRTLQQLERESQGRPKVCIALYWLLSLSPPLDAGRSPLAWLATTLESKGLEGTAFKLYLNFLEEHPAAVFDATSSRLLAAPGTPANVQRLLAARTRAAARFDSTFAREVLYEDLKIVQARLAFEAPAAWFRTKLFAADYLVWGDDDSAVRWRQDLSDVIDGAVVPQREFAGSLDRLEELLLIAEGWRRLHRFKNDKVKLLLEELARLWPELGFAWEVAFTAALRPFALNPDAALVECIQIEEAAPLLLAFFSECLDALESGLSFEHPPAPADLIDRILELLGTANDRSYPAFRGQLLTFCITQRVRPQEAAQALLEFRLPDRHPAKLWGAALAADAPLREAYRVWLLFWECTTREAAAG